MAAPAAEETPLPGAARLDLDAGADGIAVAPLTVADQFQAQPGVRRIGAVVQQRQRPSVVAEGQVRFAVVVVVGPGQAAADVALAEVAPHLRRHVPKAPLPLPQKKLRLLGEGGSLKLLDVPADVPVSDG